MARQWDLNPDGEDGMKTKLVYVLQHEEMKNGNDLQSHLR